MSLKNQGEFLVGIIEGCIVAMGALRRTTATRAEITRMRVHPDLQKHGLGQMILAHLEARAVALGERTLHLNTSPLMRAAHRLSQKNGFTQVKETRMIHGTTIICFEKYLGVPDHPCDLSLP